MITYILIRTSCYHHVIRFDVVTSDLLQMFRNVAMTTYYVTIRCIIRHQLFYSAHSVDSVKSLRRRAKSLVISSLLHIYLLGTCTSIDSEKSLWTTMDYFYDILF